MRRVLKHGGRREGFVDSPGYTGSPCAAARIVSRRGWIGSHGGFFAEWAWERRCGGPVFFEVGYGVPKRSKMKNW